MRWLLLGLSFIAFAATAAERLEAQYLYGKKYVSLAAWARQEKLDIVLRPKQSTFLLTNRWTRLQFTVDSPVASINGANVWLCYPIVAKGGGFFVSEMDLEKTLQPILSPVRAKYGDIKLIAISAGHGGKDPGYADRSTTEKEQTLLLAKELKAALEAGGLQALMIRSDDRYFTLEEQAAKANRANADLFINLHFNQAAPAIRGIETYVMPPAGAPSTAGELSSKADPGNAYDHRNILLGYEIHRSVMERFDMVDRGVRRARFIVLREAKMPAILFEGGFLSNREDAARIKDPRHRRELALAIYDGIMRYKKVVERGYAPEKLPLPPRAEPQSLPPVEKKPEAEQAEPEKPAETAPAPVEQPKAPPVLEAKVPPRRAAK